MKQYLPLILVITLLLIPLASCETLMSNSVASTVSATESASSTQNTLKESLLRAADNENEAIISPNLLNDLPPSAHKFVGTWKYSNKDISHILEDSYDLEELPPMSYEVTLTFSPDNTGSYVMKATTFDIVIVEDINETVWSASPYGYSALVTFKDDTAVYFHVWYENEMFLSLKDSRDTMYFVKQL